MWEAIAYVSSGFTLAAFVTAAAVWILKGKSEEKGRLISLADNESKVKLVQNALEFFHVEIGNLTKEQQFIVAMEQIRNRADKLKTIALLIGFLSIIAASLSAYAISELNKSTTINTPIIKTDQQADIITDSDIQLKLRSCSVSDGSNVVLNLFVQNKGDKAGYLDKLVIGIRMPQPDDTMEEETRLVKLDGNKYKLLPKDDYKIEPQAFRYITSYFPNYFRHSGGRYTWEKLVSLSYRAHIIRSTGEEKIINIDMNDCAKSLEPQLGMLITTS